jgi:hypothetical protein
VRSVAERKVRAVLALAEKCVPVFFGDERLRGKAGPLVGSITEGLVRGVTASAEEVGFALLEGDFGGSFGSNVGIWHVGEITSSVGFRLTGAE